MGMERTGRRTHGALSAVRISLASDSTGQDRWRNHLGHRSDRDLDAYVLLPTTTNRPAARPANGGTLNLSEHFTLEEFRFSEFGSRQGIPNEPSDQEIERLRETASVLERIRLLLGSEPIRISSGYRCPAINEGVGGQPDSAHLYGCAADILHPILAPAAVMKILASADLASIGIDQVILEFDQWVHVGLPRPARGQTLVIDTRGTRPWRA
jgi:hypothetical protein